MMTHWILLLLFSNNFFSFLVLRKKINRREFNTVLIECRSVHNRVHTFDMIAMWHFRSLISIYTLNKYETKCRFMYVMISVADGSLDTYLSILQQISRGYIYIYKSMFEPIYHIFFSRFHITWMMPLPQNNNNNASSTKTDVSLIWNYI
jgi:hypothetical protein